MSLGVEVEDLRGRGRELPPYLHPELLQSVENLVFATGVVSYDDEFHMLQRMRGTLVPFIYVNNLVNNTLTLEEQLTFLCSPPNQPRVTTTEFVGVVSPEIPNTGALGKDSLGRGGLEEARTTVEHCTGESS